MTRFFPSILSILLIFAHSLVIGQAGIGGHEDIPLRIEVPARSVNETYRVIPAGGNGLVLFYRSTEADDPMRTNWYFSCYDTNMQQAWVKSVPLPNEYDIRFQSSNGDTLTLLFTDAGKTQNGKGGFAIVRIVPRDARIILNEGESDAGLPVTAFRILHDHAWLTIAGDGSPDVIQRITLTTGSTTKFTTGQGDLVMVRWMEPDPANKLLHAIVTRRVNRKSTEHFFVSWDSTGVAKREILLATLASGQDFNQVRAISTGSETWLVAGTYGKAISGSAQKTNPTGASTGLFSIVIRQGGASQVSFYNFLTINSITELLGNDATSEMQKKAARRSKEMTEYSVDFSIILNELYRQDNQYILGAELFEPQYHTENFTDFDFYGRPYTNTYSVFDGYRYRNALAAAFDENGRLLWDNVAEIRNLVSHDLSPRILTFFTGDEMVMCYITDGRAGTKIMKGNNVVEKLGFAPLDLLYPDDKLLSESKGKIVKWYGNYFIASGYQEVKNISLASGNKRLVFYFSKVKFDR